MRSVWLVPLVAVMAMAQIRDPALEPVTDKPGLPRVLLLGDSISIGYTIPVRRLLAGQANVHRPSDNCGPTTHGVQFVESWIEAGKWDVVHFNFGLHDLKRMWDGKPQVTVEDYERNLRRIVERLKQTGARLVWASTTPVPEGVSPPRSDTDVLRYNQAAARVMKENGIPIDDLYGAAKPHLSEWQRSANVHFTDAGYEALAKHVVAAIVPLLP